MNAGLDALRPADLQAAARLRALERLSGGLAHDLKAPLNALLLNLELLKTSLSDGAPPKLRQPERQREWVAVLGAELERLSRGVDRLLVEVSPLRDEPATVDVSALLADVEALIAPQARQQGVELVVDPPEQPFSFRLDRSAVRRALIELGVNALEAMPGGGRLRLAAARRGEGIVLRVEDSGPGIDDEALERIFDLHFTTKPEASGIGLPVARSLLAARGGSIDATNGASGGAVFELYLPPADEE